MGWADHRCWLSFHGPDIFSPMGGSTPVSSPAALRFGASRRPVANDFGHGLSERRCRQAASGDKRGRKPAEVSTPVTCWPSLRTAVTVTPMRSSRLLRLTARRRAAQAPQGASDRLDPAGPGDGRAPCPSPPRRVVVAGVLPRAGPCGLPRAADAAAGAARRPAGHRVAVLPGRGAAGDARSCDRPLPDYGRRVSTQRVSTQAAVPGRRPVPPAGSVRAIAGPGSTPVGVR